MNIQKTQGLPYAAQLRTDPVNSSKRSSEIEKAEPASSVRQFPQAHVTVGIPILHLSGETETVTYQTEERDGDGNTHTKEEKATFAKGYNKLMIGVPIEGTPFIMGLDGDYIGVQIGNASGGEETMVDYDSHLYDKDVKITRPNESPTTIRLHRTGDGVLTGYDGKVIIDSPEGQTNIHMDNLRWGDNTITGEVTAYTPEGKRCVMDLSRLNFYNGLRGIIQVSSPEGNTVVNLNNWSLKGLSGEINIDGPNQDVTIKRNRWSWRGMRGIVDVEGPQGKTEVNYNSFTDTTINGPSGQTKLRSNMFHWVDAWNGIVKINGAY